MVGNKYSHIILVSWCWINSRPHSHFKSVKLLPLTHLKIKVPIPTEANGSKQKYICRAEHEEELPFHSWADSQCCFSTTLFSSA